MTVQHMTATLRKMVIGALFTVGVVGSVATSAPAADLSDVSREVRVALDANNPEANFEAFVTADSASAFANGTGQIGLRITSDGDASGGLSASIVSPTEQNSIDIVDTQAQGSARIGIDAFNNCTSQPCEEPLSLQFFLSDGDGPLGLTFSLDALVSTETEGATGSIKFDIN